MPNSEDVGHAAIAAARMLQRLEPGPLADLRRMDGGIGAPGFWRLAAQHPGTIGREQQAWMGIIRIMAILTPKGEPSSRWDLHDPKRRLGAVLCDGGDPTWPGTASPRPRVSERRLGQLITSRDKQREVSLTRLARSITSTRQPNSGVNVVDIAWTLLYPDSKYSAQRLAEPYYRRLDRAEREHQTNQEGAKE
ncbi:MAG: hypothetical protein OXF11_09695 [Deltaproteobacteria bacterium]|nr:hypothetical protein [Deltaproteobacteria bacterium]